MGPAPDENCPIDPTFWAVIGMGVTVFVGMAGLIFRLEASLNQLRTENSQQHAALTERIDRLVERIA